LLTRLPAKQCPLDPVPAWLLKRAAEQFARILPLSQKHTYRRYHSTETAVVIVYNDIVRSIDRREVVPLVLLELSSAIDTVDHDCLMSILRDRFSVAGVVFSWFKSYLAGQTQTFISGDDRSAPLLFVVVYRMAGYLV